MGRARRARAGSGRTRRRRHRRPPGTTSSLGRLAGRVDLGLTSSSMSGPSRSEAGRTRQERRQLIGCAGARERGRRRRRGGRGAAVVGAAVVGVVAGGPLVGRDRGRQPSAVVVGAAVAASPNRRNPRQPSRPSPPRSPPSSLHPIRMGERYGAHRGPGRVCSVVSTGANRSPSSLDPLEHVGGDGTLSSSSPRPRRLRPRPT